MNELIYNFQTEAPGEKGDTANLVDVASLTKLHYNLARTRKVEDVVYSDIMPQLLFSVDILEQHKKMKKIHKDMQECISSDPSKPYRSNYYDSHSFGPGWR